MKTYSSSVEKQAEQNFVQNYLNNLKHNKLSNKTYTRGTSSHSDLNFDQVKARRLGLVVSRTLGIKLRPSDVIVNKTAPSSGEFRG